MGERVWVMTEKVQAMGLIRYIGPMEIRGSTGTAGGDWVGVELDAPREKGNNGSVQGKVYFRCMQGRGIFVRPKKIFGISNPGGRAPGGQPDAQDWSPLSSSLGGDGSQTSLLGSVGLSPGPQRGSRQASPNASPGGGCAQSPLVKELRCRLIEASENHDTEQIEVLIPKAESLGVPSEEIEAARKILHYEAGKTGNAPRSRSLLRPENIKPARPASLSMEGDIVVDGQRRSQNAAAGVSWPGDAWRSEELTKESGELLDRMARLLSRQDQRFCQMEARLRRLEAPHEPGAVSGAVTPPPPPPRASLPPLETTAPASASAAGLAGGGASDSFGSGDGAARLRSLQQVVQNLEAKTQQHEVTMQGLTKSVESATAVALKKEFEGRIATLESRFSALIGHVEGDRAQAECRAASMEGLVSALWLCLYGGPRGGGATASAGAAPLPPPPSAASLGSAATAAAAAGGGSATAEARRGGSSAASGYPLGQQPGTAASGGAASQASAIAGALPLAALRAAFARHASGGSGGGAGGAGAELPTERLADVFAELGFSVSDPSKLAEVVDVHKTGKVSFDAFCSSAFKPSAGSASLLTA